MKLKMKKATLILAVLAMLVATVSPALAQTEPQPPAPPPSAPAPSAPTPCPAGQVSGTVVAVDPATGTLTIEYKDATGATLYCTATLTGSYDHPIVTLLGKYFGDISPETLAAALNDTKGCVLQDPTTLAYSWVDCSTAGAVPVTVAGQNPDGTFSVKLADGTLVSVSIADQATIDKILAALKALAVSLQDGDVVLVSDRIAMYHDQGMGFGVLVKLYFLASTQPACVNPASAECAAAVQALVDEFKGGTGMGLLFKKYGKPAGLGVGHVRQKIKNQGDETGVGNANGNGNGNGNSGNQPPGQLKPKKNQNQYQNQGLCKPKSHGNGPKNCP
jgi:hypothetical protein